MAKNPAKQEPVDMDHVLDVAKLVGEMFFAEYGRYPENQEIRLMRLGIEVSLEWKRRLETAARGRDFRPGDIVENLLNPSLDYRAVVNVGDDWLTILLPGGESSHFPKANYRVVNPID